MKQLPWYIGNGHIFYDRYQQLEALFDRAYDDKLPKNPERYWDIIGEVWKRTECPHHQYVAWFDIFSLTPGVNSYTKEWLKDPKIVYRGINKNYLDVDFDWSWTTDRDKAEWFANRFGCTDPLVLEFDTRKDPYRVWCVFEDDPENEVLLWSPRAGEYYEDRLYF